MLRKQMPKNYSIKKIMDVVSCLCRLHNFLIDDKEDHSPVPSSEEDKGNLAVYISDAAPLERNHDGIMLPLQLMDAGHHRNDDPLRLQRESRRHQSTLPRSSFTGKYILSTYSEHIYEIIAKLSQKYQFYLALAIT